MGEGEVSVRDRAYNAHGDRVGESRASDEEEENLLQNVFVGDFRASVRPDDRCFSAVQSDRFPRLPRLVAA